MHVFVVELVRLSALLAQSAWVTASLKSTQISASIAVLAQVHARQALSLRHNLTGKKHILKRKKTTRLNEGCGLFMYCLQPETPLLELCLRCFLKQPELLFRLWLLLLVRKRKVDGFVLLLLLRVFRKLPLAPVLP